MKRSHNLTVLLAPLTCLIILCMQVSVCAQNRKLDSLVKTMDESKQRNHMLDSLHGLLRAAKHDSTRLSVYLKLAKFCEIHDNMKYAEPALIIVNRLLKNARTPEEIKKYRKLEGDVYIYVAAYYNNPNGGQYSKAMEIWRKAVETYKLGGYPEGVLNRLDDMADNSFIRGEYMEQLGYLQEGVTTLKKMKHLKGESFFHSKLARFYANMGDTVAAINHVDKQMSLEREINDSGRFVDLYLRPGLIYAQLGKFDKALTLFYNALRVPKTIVMEVPEIYQHIGRIHVEKGQLDSALSAYKISLRYSEQLGNPRYIFMTIRAIGEIYSRMGKHDDALKQHEYIYNLATQVRNEGAIRLASEVLAQDYIRMGNYRKAKQFSDRVADLATKFGAVADKMNAEEIAYRVDSALANHEKALVHFQNYIKWKEKLKSDEVHKAALQEHFMDEYEKKKLLDRMEHEKKEAAFEEEKQIQRIALYAVSAGLVLVLITTALVLRAYRQKQKANRELARKNETIERQKREVVAQKHLLEEKNREIMDSINYARRLQQAILPSNEFISSHLPESFILYEPKDIVAGDFYWAESIDDRFYIAAADSTGHGVPGALVSVVCSTALNRAVNEFNERETGKILDKTRELVIETFQKSNDEVKDGMDISLLCVERSRGRITWSGANNPLWYVNKGELQEISSDKQPIGKTDNARPFTTHELPFVANTIYYLFTDGLADQFGGPKGKKFKYKQFSELLYSLKDRTAEEKMAVIYNAFKKWKGDLEQVDDVCVIGVTV